MVCTSHGGALLQQHFNDTVGCTRRHAKLNELLDKDQDNNHNPFGKHQDDRHQYAHWRSWCENTKPNNRKGAIKYKIVGDIGCAELNIDYNAGQINRF